jgi:hypothetical protein
MAACSNESARTVLNADGVCLQKFDPETGRHRPRCREQLSESPGPAPNLAAPGIAFGGSLSKGASSARALEGADSAPASDIFCAKRLIPPPFAPPAQRLMRMTEGRAGNPEAGPAPRSRSAAERPQEVPRLPGATARVPGESSTWFQKFYQNGGGILVLAETNVRRRGHGLPLLLFTRRGTAECELCLQFRNLFAKRCQLILYSSGSGIHI